nr:HAD family hydrolase [Gracilibacillus boraciitolerans]
MKTIIFDVDDTLYDQLQPFHKAVHQQLNTSFNNDEIKALYLASRKYSDEVFEKHMNGGEITALDLQTYRITKACQDFGISLTYQQAVTFQETYLHEQQQIQLFPAIVELLDSLYANNKQLAILTNGEVDHQMMKVQRLGITQWVPAEHIFVSARVGYSKPSQKLFEYVENTLELDKDHTVYIGDSFENDIIGAKQMGWSAIWMNHRQRTKPVSNHQPDHTIESSDDLLAIFDIMEEV